MNIYNNMFYIDAKFLVYYDENLFIIYALHSITVYSKVIHTINAIISVSWQY